MPKLSWPALASRNAHTAMKSRSSGVRVDPRFVQESDVLSTLDTRPNLMEPHRPIMTRRPARGKR
jgi:hypothetical protein